MLYSKEHLTFNSTNGSDTIHYYVYSPQDKPRALLQLSHGMCEYIERYDHLADFLTSNGIIVFGNDHLGHGKNIDNDDNLGYFSKKNGWKYLASDLNILTQKMKQQYPELPCYLLGHSMGSFVARNYIVRYGQNIDGAIICGTSGGNALSPAGIFFADIIKLFKGDRHRSAFLNDLAFKNYNRKFKDPVSVHDWLSKDRKIVEKYDNDKYCNFIFTTSAFIDIARLLDSVSDSEWYNAVPKNLPIHLIAGDMDPVGNYGKGVMKVYKKLENKGIKNLSVKLYKNDRHEIFNETDKDVVMKDILRWLNAQIKDYNN